MDTNLSVSNCGYIFTVSHIEKWFLEINLRLTRPTLLLSLDIPQAIWDSPEVQNVNTLPDDTLTEVNYKGQTSNIFYSAYRSMLCSLNKKNAIFANFPELCRKFRCRCSSTLVVFFLHSKLLLNSTVPFDRTAMLFYRHDYSHNLSGNITSSKNYKATTWLVLKLIFDKIHHDLTRSNKVLL